MTLSNAQYNAIQREYDSIQLSNRQVGEQRRREVYSSCPAYREAEDAIASVSVKYGKLLLEGDEDILEEYHGELARLSSRKKELLTGAGFPADYLDPVYTCPDCRDTGYRDGIPCRCFKQRVINLLYAQSNLQELLKTENFSTLSYEYYKGEDLESFKKAVETAFSFVDNFSGEYQNLLFYGDVGTGKSFLSNCIAREILNRGYSVIYFSAASLFQLLAKISFDTDKNELYKSFEDLYNCDLVIIDDLGTELTNTFTNSSFFTFLNERSLRRKSVIISTNLGLEQLKNLYSERILSRLTNNFTFRKITGPDIRLRKNM